MRIAIITENFLPKVDGVTRTLARLLEYLQAHNHQVIVLGPASGLDTYAGAQIHGTAGLPFPPYPELKLNLWRPEFTKQLIQFQPHVIHLVDPVFLCAAALFTILKLNKDTLSHIPIIASYHTNLASYCVQFGYGRWLANLMWKWNRFCHAQCRYTVCPSLSTKLELERRGFQNVRLWFRGIDTLLFTPTRRSAALRYQWLFSSVQQQLQYASPVDEKQQKYKEKVIILYVGRVSYEKNLRLLLESYKGMDHDQCHLVMVGDGPALQKMKRDCHQSNIPVTFTGYLHGVDLATAYASADIFAFPSFTETFGQVILESTASGLPVVGVLSDGVRDLVTDQETGYLMDMDDVPKSCSSDSEVAMLYVQKYRSLLTKLVEDSEARIRLGRKAIERAKTYTWDSAMEMIVQTYWDAVLEYEYNSSATNNRTENVAANSEKELGHVTRIIMEKDLNSKEGQIQHVETVCESSIYSK